jgi:hypothetical protein
MQLLLHFYADMLYHSHIPALFPVSFLNIVVEFLPIDLLTLHQIAAILFRRF